MPGKTETPASVREAFEQVQASYEGWTINGPDDEVFRLQVVNIGVPGIIAAANQLPDSEERRALVEEMTQWLRSVQPEGSAT